MQSYPNESIQVPKQKQSDFSQWALCWVSKIPQRCHLLVMQHTANNFCKHLTFCFASLSLASANKFKSYQGGDWNFFTGNEFISSENLLERLNQINHLKDVMRVIFRHGMFPIPNNKMETIASELLKL